MVGWLGAIIRFIVSAFVLLGVSALVPGMEVVGFTNALIAAVIIAFLGFILESVVGEETSPQARGIIGFTTSAVVIYFTQYLVTGMAVTTMGALLSALAIGIIDTFVPTELR
ncbi:phage holin family protein [Halanaerobaculum tunisiense]